jgi:hypothetical protein
MNCEQKYGAKRHQRPGKRGNANKALEKMAKHQCLLNELFDIGQTRGDSDDDGDKENVPIRNEDDEN